MLTGFSLVRRNESTMTSEAGSVLAKRLSVAATYPVTVHVGRGYGKKALASLYEHACAGACYCLRVHRSIKQSKKRSGCASVHGGHIAPRIGDAANARCITQLGLALEVLLDYQYVLHIGSYSVEIRERHR